MNRPRGRRGRRGVALFLTVAALVPALVAGGAIGSSQAVTGRYLLAFQACDPKLPPITLGGVNFSCPQPPTQRTYLAQSDDGVGWSLVPGWKSPLGLGVPDVIRRGDTIFVYANDALAQFTLDVYRYSVKSGAIASSEPVTIEGLEGAGPIEPSLIQDADGSLVLFFDQQGSDPYVDSALCTNHGAEPGQSCETQILSATEVAGSNGTTFRLDPGVRARLTLSQSRWAGDPDVFSDGKSYFLTVAGAPDAGVIAFGSATLHGSFARISNLVPDSPTGCCAAGYFDSQTQKFWTYAHGRSAGPQSPAAIRRAVSPDLTHGLTAADFAQVLPNAQVLPGFDTGEPSFAVNDPGLAAPIACHVLAVTGKSLAQARSALAGAHCSTGTITRHASAKVGAGKVISQKPAAGASRAAGAKVDLVVSTGRRRP